MKAQKLLQHLQDLLEAEPSLADADVWYAKDQEGNGYEAVGFLPSTRLLYTRPGEPTYYADELRTLEEFDDLAAEAGIYTEDFNNEAEYREAAAKAIEEEYKVVLLVN